MVNSKGGLHLARVSKAECSRLQVSEQPDAAVMHEYLGVAYWALAGVKLFTTALAQSSVLPWCSASRSQLDNAAPRLESRSYCVLWHTCRRPTRMRTLRKMMIPWLAMTESPQELHRYLCGLLPKTDSLACLSHLPCHRRVYLLL